MHVGVSRRLQAVPGSGVVGASRVSRGRQGPDWTRPPTMAGGGGGVLATVAGSAKGEYPSV